MLSGNAILFSISELCWGKAAVGYAKLQQWKKEDSKSRRGESDTVKFVPYSSYSQWLESTLSFTLP